MVTAVCVALGLVVYAMGAWYTMVVVWARIRRTQSYPDMFDAVMMGLFWPVTAPGYVAVKGLIKAGQALGRSIEKGADWRG